MAPQEIKVFKVEIFVRGLFPNMEMVGSEAGVALVYEIPTKQGLTDAVARAKMIQEKLELCMADLGWVTPKSDMETPRVFEKHYD